ncbi:hypothetical protein LXL04_034980 [Taraxacum kok-saghyz]
MDSALQARHGSIGLASVRRGSAPPVLVRYPPFKSPTPQASTWRVREIWGASARDEHQVRKPGSDREKLIWNRNPINLSGRLNRLNLEKQPGPFVDRLDYSWFQGSDDFFRKRIEKNQSTVFRTNVPPSFPFFLANPNVVAVLDCKSFAHMFDMELVDKKNILVGDFMPSTKFTGDRRVCAYLDTTEHQHEQRNNSELVALREMKKLLKLQPPRLTHCVFDEMSKRKLDAMEPGIKALKVLKGPSF